MVAWVSLMSVACAMVGRRRVAAARERRRRIGELYARRWGMVQRFMPKVTACTSGFHGQCGACESLPRERVGSSEFRSLAVRLGICILCPSFVTKLALGFQNTRRTCLQ